MISASLYLRHIIQLIMICVVVDGFPISSRMFSTKTDRFFSYDSITGSKKTVDITNDYVFKNIFKHKEILKNFLENVLVGDNKILPSDSVIEELKYLPYEYMQDKIPEEGRRTVFDLQVKTNNGIFIVEMQKDARSEYLSRVEFYSAIAFNAQPLKEGPHIKMKEYVNAVPVVTISILGEDSNQNIFSPDAPCISYHINTEQQTHKQYMKAFSYVFIDLQKFKEQDDIQEDLQDWLRFFKTQDLHYNYHNEQVKNAIKYVDDIRENKYEIYLRHLLTEQVYQTEKQEAKAEGKAEGLAEGKAEGLAEGKAEGLAEGKAEGLAEGKAEGLAEGKAKHKAESSASTVLELLDSGLPPEKIAKAAGITIAQFKQIIAKDDKSPTAITQYLLEPNNQNTHKNSLPDDLECLGENVPKGS